MSITSCPRCAGQVTLPLGVSNDATVRCPLCHAQYTLSDALENVPPSLEVVDVAGETAPGVGADALPADDAPLVAAAMPADEPLDELEFPAEDAGDDAVVDQEHDTEVEELSFSTFDGETPQAEPADEPVAESADDDELALDFGEELSAEDSEAETLELGAARPSESPRDTEFAADESLEPAEEEAAALDFNEEPGEAGDEVQFDLDAPHETASGGDATIEFDNSDGIQFEPEAPQEAAAGEPSELQEFGDFQVDPTGEAEDIPLDVPDEPAAAPVAAGDDEEPSGKKKRKKKKAKATNGKPKGSALVRFGVPLIIGVPVALYAALWVGYDFAGLSGILPGFMVPAAEKGDTRLAHSAGRPATTSGLSDAGDASMPDLSPASPSLEEPLDAASPETPSTEDMPADEPPALGLSDEPLPADAAATPPSDAPKLDPSDPATPSEPADDPFAPSAAPEKMPAEDADSAAGDNPFAQPESPAPDENPFGPADAAPEKMPAEGADSAPVDDPFARPSSPELPPTEPAPELPTEPETKPAAPADDANPFGTPAADTQPEPAADDPFAPSPSARPIEDAPTDSEPLPVPAEPAQPIEPLGPRNSAEVSPAEVAEALQATMAADQQMAAVEGTGDAAEVRKARTNFYVTLYNMANAMTLGQMGPDAAQLDPQLRALEPIVRRQLTTDPKRFASLKVFGTRWFSFSKRPTNGVVLAGTVESVDQAGKLFHARVRPGQNAEGAVTIVSAKDPQLTAGDEVLTLGSIVENPSDQLAGYEGSEPAVVWSGMTLKIAPPGQ